MTKDVLRIAAVGDLHCTKRSQGALQPWHQTVVERADVLLLLGDLTDYGTKEEAEVLAAELATYRMPILAVLGNHDLESDAADEVRAALAHGGVVVLDGDSYELHGIGFVGVKGFMGGFGRRALEPWGERSLKALVHEAIDEALKLESAISRMRTTQNVVMLHYSPVLGTVEGEAPELWPFLGSTRLEEVVDRYDATVVFHGHAHRGSPEASTRGGVPVFNVAMPLLRRVNPGGVPFRFYDLAIATEGVESDGGGASAPAQRTG